METVAAWHLRFYDEAGALITVIDRLVAPAYERRIAQSSPVSFGLHADDPKAGKVSLARAWALYRGSENVASGRIITRNLTSNPWTYQALTNEVNLEHIHLPSSWGEVYRRWDLGHVVEDLLRDRKTFRVNTQAGWQAYLVDSSQVDLNVEPGKVTLARFTHLDGLRYYESGYLTLSFTDPGDGYEWERLRWSEIVGDVTRIKIQYSTDGGATWSDEMEATNAEEVQMNEEVGVLLSGESEPILVRLNLYTDDTESPFYDDEFMAENPNTTQVYGRTPILTGIEPMTSRPGEVLPHITDFPPTEGTGILVEEPQDWGGATAYTALQDLHDLYGWEWYVDGSNQLHFVEKLGTDKTATVVLRQGTNLELRGLEDSDEEIANVVIGRGEGEGLAQLESRYRHEQSITDHAGVEFVEVVDFPGVTDQAELDQKTQEYSEAHAYAKPPLDGTLYFQPGEEPDLGLGDVVRVVHPKSETMAKGRILDIRRKDTDVGEEWRLGLNAKVGAGSLVDRLSRRPPKSRRHEVPPVAAFSVQGDIEAIILSWQGTGEFQIQHTAKFADNGAPIEWSMLERSFFGNRYSHGPLKFASKHAYRVRRMRNGRASSWTPALTALAKDTTPPGPPTGVTASSIIKGIAVDFNKPSESDWAESWVWVSDEGPVDTSGPPVARGKATHFEITSGLVSRKIYFAVVRHVDISGNHSADSMAVTAVADSVAVQDIDQLFVNHMRNVSNFLTGLESVTTYTPDAKLAVQGSDYVSPESNIYAVSIQAKVVARASGIIDAGNYEGWVRVEWSLFYRVNGGSWTLWQSDDYRVTDESPVLEQEEFGAETTRTYSLNVDGGTMDHFEVRVVYTDHDRKDGHTNVDESGTWVRVTEITFDHQWQGPNF